jgi:hypothetical protein
MFVQNMKEILAVINQCALLELKLIEQNAEESVVRMLQRIRASWENMGYTYILPIGEKYNETRTDVAANIVGETSDDLIITQIVKPVIYFQNQIVQQGIVIAASQK